MASASTFILNDIITQNKKTVSSNALQTRVSPMVIMSILNHFQRRPSNKQRANSNQPQNLYPDFVIGLLFGRKDVDNNALIINDAFGLETQIDPQTQEVALELAKAKEVLKLHASAHPNDRMVGWYRTGLQIERNSNSIHEAIIIKALAPINNKISRNAGKQLDESEYVHLLVDTELKNDKLSVKSYTTECILDPIQKQEYADYLKEKKRRERLSKQKPKQSKSSRKKRRKKASQNATPNNEAAAEETNKLEELEPLVEVEKPYAIFYRFKEIQSVYHASESERIGLDMIIESPPEGTALDSPSLLMNDTNHLESVLQNLLQNLEQVEQYVHMVINGEADGDEALGWLIGDALSSVPNLSPAKFEEMMSNRLQDFLMMGYLGKMTKAQLIIADKINKVLPSTVPGFEQDTQ